MVKNIEVLKREFIVILEILLFSLFASLARVQIFGVISVLCIALLVRVIIKYRKILKLQ